MIDEARRAAALYASQRAGPRGLGAGIRMLVQFLREPMLMSLQRTQSSPRNGEGRHPRTPAFVEAVRDRDVVRAQTIMTEHLGRTAARLAMVRRSLSL